MPPEKLLSRKARSSFSTTSPNDLIFSKGNFEKKGFSLKDHLIYVKISAISQFSLRNLPILQISLKETDQILLVLSRGEDYHCQPTALQ